MSDIPADLKYAKSHEWVRVLGAVATVGITDHAQHELTDVVFVELPRKFGRKLQSGGSMRRGGIRQDRLTTFIRRVSGEVTEMNKAVVDNPALANAEPYNGGWFYKIKLSNPAELNALLSAEQHGSKWEVINFCVGHLKKSVSSAIL